MKQPLTIVPYKRRAAKQRKMPQVKSKPVRRVKLSKVGLKRLWGVPDHAWMRYSGLKGIYWYFFSKYVRERDYTYHNGLCMTCEEYVERGQDQGGHLFAAKGCGFELLFHPLNVHLQHAKCNNPRFTPSAGVKNTLTINKRYGPKTVEWLLGLQKTSTIKEWNKARYEEEIQLIKAELVRISG
jgi:hypothetical protein